jgi:hypothetical protein
VVLPKPTVLLERAHHHCCACETVFARATGNSICRTPRYRRRLPAREARWAPTKDFCPPCSAWVPMVPVSCYVPANSRAER